MQQYTSLPWQYTLEGVARSTEPEMAHTRRVSLPMPAHSQKHRLNHRAHRANAWGARGTHSASSVMHPAACQNRCTVVLKLVSSPSGPLCISALQCADLARTCQPVQPSRYGAGQTSTTTSCINCQCHFVHATICASIVACQYHNLSWQKVGTVPGNVLAF